MEKSQFSRRKPGTVAALLPYSNEDTNNKMLEGKALKAPADVAPAGALVHFGDV